MKRFLGALATSIIACYANTCLAQTYPSADMVTSTMRDWCAEVLKPDGAPLMQSACVMYFMGVWDGIVVGLTVAPVRPSQNVLGCPNPPATNKERIRTFVDYAYAHPETGAMLPGLVLHRAMNERYPCPRGNIPH